MKTLKQSIIAVAFLIVVAGVSVAQPPTTATTFRMYNDPTHTVSIMASTTAAGTGTFTWPQPAAGIFKSDVNGIMSLSAINLGTGSTDITGILNVSNGGTGVNSVGPANSVAYSNGTTLAYTGAPIANVNSILVSLNGGAPSYSTSLPTSINVPFSDISTGTNTQATMTVGSGASIVLGGTGTVAANQFQNGGTTNAVDLNSVWNGTTGEVNGTLGTGNGGTGNTTVGAAGTVAYSDGTKINYTTVGTSGQVLQSNASGAPSWTTLASQALAKGRIAGDGVNYSYTITPGVTIPAGSTIIATLESGTNMSVTVTGRTTTTFTVQAPVKLQTTDFINYLVF